MKKAPESGLSSSSIVTCFCGSDWLLSGIQACVVGVGGLEGGVGGMGGSGMRLEVSKSSPGT